MRSHHKSFWAFALILSLSVVAPSRAAEECGLYGDVVPPGGNSIVNLDDILCGIGAFSNFAACPDADIRPACSEDGIINLDDILAIIGAFGNPSPKRCTDQEPPFASVPTISSQLGFIGQMVTGDLDHDGDLDVAGSANGGLTWGLNDGSATFSWHFQEIQFGSAEEILLADLDGDTHLDAIKAGQHRIYLYLGNGDGTFAPGSSMTTNGSNLRGAVGDLDGDADPDVALACLSNCNFGGPAVLRLYENDGGMLSARPGLPIAPLWEARAVDIGDLDGDLDNDIVIGGQGLDGAESVIVFTNNGTGTFTSAGIYLPGLLLDDVHLAFLDSDPDLDIVVATKNPGTNAISVMLNHGDATFAPPVGYGSPFTPYAGWSQVTAGDVDGDLDLDLLTSGFNLFRNDGTGAFELVGRAVSVPLPTSPFALDDFDGDNDPDILTAGLFFANDGAGNFGSYQFVAASPFPLALADMDGDFDLDVAVGSIGSGSVSILFNDGNATLSQPTEYPDELSPYGLVAADLNGDLAPDLAMTNLERGAVRVRMNLGGGVFGTAAEYAADDHVYSLAAADLDGDVDADLVTANTSSHSISVFTNNGSGIFAEPVNYSVPPFPYYIGIGDLDGDSDHDLAVAHFAGDPGVSILLNDGDGTFALAAAYPARGSQSLVLVDLDTDGDLDIVTGSLVVLTNLGAANFASTQYDIIVDFTILTVGDFDGDNDPDIAVPEISQIKTLMNICDGALAFPFVTTGGVQVRAAAAGDMDGDGDIDLAVTSATSNTVSVIRNRLVPPF